MAKRSYYHFRTYERRQYVCVKLDQDFQIGDTYFLEDRGAYLTCDCPAGSMHGFCRHIKLFGVFRKARAIDERVVYDYKDGVFLLGSKIAEAAE